MHFKFWLKTALYRLYPGGYGYYGILRHNKQKKYTQPETVRNIVVRVNEKGALGWQAAQKGLEYRQYDAYEEYVTHQKAKFDTLIHRDGGFPNQVVMSYRLQFYRRFKHLKRILPRNADILCLGARQGTEVEVLRDIGFRRAYGIDLNPGPDNPFVSFGDFMHLKEADGSVDFIYSNALDHSFDLPGFFKENIRVLKNGGHALYDIAIAERRSFEAASWESDAVILRIMLDFFPEVVRIESDSHWKWLLLRKIQ